MLYAQDLTHPSHDDAQALAGRRILSRTDSDGRSAGGKTGKSVQANLSRTLPTAAAAVATATPSAGATASIHLDAQSSRPGQPPPSS